MDDARRRLQQHLEFSRRSRAQMVAGEAAAVALCNKCGTCTSADTCSRCGASMEEALSLWRRAGASASGDMQQPRSATPHEGARIDHSEAARLCELLESTVGEAVLTARTNQQDTSDGEPDEERLRAARATVAGLADIADEAASTDECAVCLHKLNAPFSGDGAGRDVVAPPCGHLFHRGCLLKWMSYHQSCPVCKCQVRGAVDRRSSNQMPR